MTGNLHFTQMPSSVSSGSSDWRNVSDEDLLRAAEAELELPLWRQPDVGSANFEVVCRALVLCCDTSLEFFDRTHRRLIIRWLLRSPQLELGINEVDDLVNMVYMRVISAWRNMSRDEFYSKFRGSLRRVFGYLLLACRSVVASEARRRRHDTLSLNDEITSSSYTVDEWSARHIDIQRRVQHLLSAEEYHIFEMLMYGYIPREIAERVGRQTGYVRRCLNKCYKKLRNDSILRDLLG
ncbi:MAG: hypothetical protein RML95_10155 [Anaerolineae bacterium]|nr:hypothetical protein [Anaerolineae bacterium]